MKKIIDMLHIICIALIPGYWIGALVVFAHHKIKKQPVKIIQEKNKIQETVHKTIHAHKKEGKNSDDK